MADVSPASTVVPDAGPAADPTAAPDQAPEVDAAPHLSLPEFDGRERALPIRPGDLVRLLMDQPDLGDDDRTKLGQFGPLLGSIFHSEFFTRLRELKELYSPLDPDSDYIRLAKHTRLRTERSDDDFLPPFVATLQQANYRELELDVIKQAVAAPNEMGLTYVPDFGQFEHLRIFARGYTQIARSYRNASTRFRKRTVLLDAYQRMVVALKFRAGVADGAYVRDDVFYLRMFKDVPHVDMEMHLPEQGTRVKMRWIDKAQIASPVVMGVPALAMKVLGLSFAALTNPFALAPLMAMPISAGVNSFFGFQRAKHKHLSSMIRNLYYLTLANNASVLNRLIDSAEEEEFKETLLSYFFLWRAVAAGESCDEDDLDGRIERFLAEVSGVEINFEVHDAVGKLFRLGLARRDVAGRLHPVAIDEALATLDRRWDNTFRYA